MLPRELREDLARRTDPRAPSALHDERGQSRMRRVWVHVEWDEAGVPDSVDRTTYAYDAGSLEELFPSKAEEGGADEEKAPEENSLDALRKDAPPELQAIIDEAQGVQP
jgi:hypothetical protein